MKEFFKRLLIVFGHIVGAILAVVLLIGVTVLVINENPIIMFVIKWIIGVPVGIIISISLIGFVYW
ncbi:hypothetical protein, partial [Cytobacillus praedii]